MIAVGELIWLLICAQICMFYPNALPNVIVAKFFSVFEQWKWPNPVMLCPIQDLNLGHKVWNPRVSITRPCV